MTLKELTHEQKLALTALIEAVTISDGNVSDSEEQKINRLMDEFGEENFRALLDEVETRFESREDLYEFLEGFENKEACELIFGTVMDEVMASPSTDGGPTELLDWLAVTWGVDVGEGSSE